MPHTEKSFLNLVNTKQMVITIQICFGLTRLRIFFPVFLREDKNRITRENFQRFLLESSKWELNVTKLSLKAVIIAYLRPFFCEQNVKVILLLLNNLKWK